MSYLICRKCGGYYELQSGERPEEFSDTCECGGKLEYVKQIDPKDADYKSWLLKGLPISLLLLILLWLFVNYFPLDNIPRVYLIGGFVFILFLIGITTGKIKMGN